MKEKNIINSPERKTSECKSKHNNNVILKVEDMKKNFYDYMGKNNICEIETDLSETYQNIVGGKANSENPNTTFQRKPNVISLNVLP